MGCGYRLCIFRFDTFILIICGGVFHILYFIIKVYVILVQVMWLYLQARLIPQFLRIFVFGQFLYFSSTDAVQSSEYEVPSAGTTAFPTGGRCRRRCMAALTRSTLQMKMGHFLLQFRVSQKSHLQCHRKMSQAITPFHVFNYFYFIFSLTIYTLFLLYFYSMFSWCEGNPSACSPGIHPL